ncbi:hypothetical protein UCRPC4_g05835 [Phaeomoniella chlamydospora]|uniref:Glutamyl-tRNA amidotransferase complex subunit Gta3 domain-containing protein n=1 Tax=Phaeomoniella chlamydospora TaxID=158046 RepID=A0A0G2E1G5_PHACM|nr:hypothetical protein UCRPC4_g05835 [Phaeomoniella chlamydospora]
MKGGGSGTLTYQPDQTFQSTAIKTHLSDNALNLYAKMFLRRLVSRSAIWSTRPCLVRKQSRLSKDEISDLLSKPTWSVRSLLPDQSSSTTHASNGEITPTQLRHLLRLSALPQPRTPEEELDMLKTLSSQIHFVKEVQAVSTDGVEPLRAIRDETAEGIKNATIGLDQMKEYLDQEEVVGRNGRIRWKKASTLPKGQQKKKDIPDWDPLELAQEKRGRFFVVKREKKQDNEPGSSISDEDAPP